MGSICSSADCGKPTVGRGLCKNHYQKHRYQTDPVFRQKRLQRRETWRLENPEKAKTLHKKYYEKHKTRILQEEKDKRLADPTIAQRARLRTALKLYGLSPDALQALRDFQQGCGLCKQALLAGSVAYNGECIDHNHKTGEARGLLCAGCNKALGIYEKRQKIAGLVISVYDNYLASTPIERLSSRQRATSDPVSSESDEA